MSSSKITIAGAEKWFNDHDSSLFASAVFPEGIEKDLIVDAVIMRGGEFEVLYSDLDFMQNASARWARRWNRTFSKWITALQIEYEPLYNYDRTEQWTTVDDGTDLTTRNTQDLETRNLATSGNRTTETDTTGSSTDTGSGTSTDSVSAYNSSIFENDRKNDSTSSGTTSTESDQTQTETTGGTDTGTINTAGTGTVKIDRDNTNTRNGRAFGNIGVTTSQQMLQSELDLQYWNLYEHIADIYLNEFAIPVY